MSEIEVAFDHVTKDFPGSGTGAFRAVDDVSLDIAKGELVALLGKTGCGKSTLFNLAAGLTQPTAGKVRVKGRDPFGEFNWFRGKMAIVFQNDRLLPWRGAARNVEIGLEMLDIPPAERRARALKWLARLGLAGHEDAYPHALSGGMRQRVSIARAFATDADILLCDEPFSALDEITGERLRNEFAGLVRENRKTAIFITHSINEALRVADRIVVLRRPARIAMDARVPVDATQAQRDDLRARIESILAE